VADWL